VLGDAYWTVIAPYRCGERMRVPQGSLRSSAIHCSEGAHTQQIPQETTGASFSYLSDEFSFT